MGAKPQKKARLKAAPALAKMAKARAASASQALTIHLEAELQPSGAVTILGSRARVGLPRGSGPHTFKFKLTDRTGLNVRFVAFGAELNAACPAAPGDNTGQITGLSIQASKAEFTDENSQLCTFGYTWFFSCDDPNQTPTFDPIVDNGGR